MAIVECKSGAGPPPPGPPTDYSDIDTGNLFIKRCKEFLSF